MKTKIMLAAAITTLLSGCWWNQKPQPQVEPIEPRIYNVVKHDYFMPDRPYPINPLDLKFYVLTEQNLEQQIGQIKQDNGGAPFSVIAMTPKTYESLSINQANYTRYIRDILGLLEYYERLINEINQEDIITPAQD